MCQVCYVVGVLVGVPVGVLVGVLGVPVGVPVGVSVGVLPRCAGWCAWSGRWCGRCASWCAWCSSLCATYVVCMVVFPAILIVCVGLDVSTYLHTYVALLVEAQSCRCVLLVRSSCSIRIVV